MADADAAGRFVLEPNMNGYAEFSPSATKEPMDPQPSQALLQEDVDMSSGSNETNESSSAGRDSQGSDCDDGKELRMLLEPPDTLQGPGAFHLQMMEPERNPSTSGCSEQSAKADTHRELIRTLRELKVHLPADKQAKGKASTLATLKYALRSVKQVKANEEYFQLLPSSEGQPCRADVPSYAVEQVGGVASEHLLKNADMFAVAVSLVTGKILYISDQVTSVFRCKKDAFGDAKFVEFLAPQDVSVFHSFTTPCKLPPWSTCSGVDSFTQECMEAKSFFCRLGVGKNHENEIRYQPFRMTPYLAKVQEQPAAESQLCCLLLVERVHSGYEAPRIPPEKRIFTTTHTPNCLFQDVDERAVPLLGYLPQDLIETPVLLQFHPSDRPLMLAIHKKILQSGGQPFDYSPIRFRTRNGEYVTLDTSWSSFVNPWSRKISFIIGRHRVRVGPLNEDVFAALPCAEEKALQPSVQELTEQIHRLLLQPVPHSGSSGYGSLGSNGSHEHLMSQTSSSDSNGHEESRQRRSEIYENGTKTKSRGRFPHEFGEQKKASGTEIQSLPATEEDSLGASVPRAGIPEELACKDQPACSYQQISCLDSVIRYLESCSEAASLKRKCEFPANIPSPKATASPGLRPAGPPQTPSSGIPAEDSNVHARPLLLWNSLFSPFSIEGTQHRHQACVTLMQPPVPQSLRLFLPLSLQGWCHPPSQCSYSSTIVHVGDKKPQPESEMVEEAASGPESLDCLPHSVSQEKGPLQALGLTKEVLAAHTQREEQSFLQKFRGARRLGPLQAHGHCYSREQPRGPSSERTVPGLSTSRTDSSWKKAGKSRKLKSRRAKPRGPVQSTGPGGLERPRHPLVNPGAMAWSPSDTCPSSCPAVAFPTPVPTFPLPMFPAPGTVAPPPAAPHSGLVMPALPMDSRHEFAVQPLPVPAPWAPVMALMLSAYPSPPVAPSLPQACFPGQPHFPGHPMLPSEMTPASRPECPRQTSLPRQPCTCPATQPSATVATGRASPPLFQSRGSSPLQLNLLQMEEPPEGSAGAAATTGAATARPDCTPGISRDQQPKAPPTQDEPPEAQESDAVSVSSDLLHLLLSEDLCSATGSALSGSGASAASESLGCTTSPSGAGSTDTSCISKYFGSIDSSENNHKAETSRDKEQSEHLMKCVLQDPVWLLMADTDDSVMMTYQLPSRALESVLREDREKLALLRRFQPCFTEGQRQELREVHPWVQTGGLPTAIDVAECIYCGSEEKGSVRLPYEGDVPSLGLGDASDTQEEESGHPLSHREEGQT
ncbi:period circadian protein homolog 2 isoform X2 [Sciurus carolinensis]|uniref:period circadian protein homolog 2 isoform X2 n=1 Tax=Sciurus carolinensis TaxID=30640 RepID=UPI001FB55E6B|nr:period circadian protein homolog 2 isoform X2 [Sciurus carolinensis]